MSKYIVLIISAFILIGCGKNIRKYQGTVIQTSSGPISDCVEVTTSTKGESNSIFKCVVGNIVPFPEIGDQVSIEFIKYYSFTFDTMDLKIQESK